MIIDSDNTATNMLTELLGFGYINWVLKEKLYLKLTNFNCGIMDSRMRSLGIENYTTAEDIGLLLEKIYRGKVITKEISNQMLNILKRQRINDRIPRFLPQDLEIAHKTGLMRQQCHDAGIVFTPKGNFVICILINQPKNIKVAKMFIADIAYKTYQCY